MEVLIYYNMVLTQLVPNVIEVIISFERICRDEREVSSLALFRSFFVLKTSRVPRYPLSWWYQFSPRASKKLKVSLPSKNAKWNDLFVFLKFLGRGWGGGVEISVL